jgi:shikimate dehydrogenase
MNASAMTDILRLDGHTRPFAVLGHPVGHTFSPAMHNAAFRALNWNAVYLAFDVAPERLMEVLRAMGAMGFGGVNLTVPLKEVAFRGIPCADESARVTGSINTVRFAEEGLEGYSTDGYGFLRAVREAFGEPLRGQSVFLVGAGGAGRALASACVREGIARLALTDLDRSRAERVAAEARILAPALPVVVADTPREAVSLAREADLIVQATPLGLKNDDPPPLPPEAFRPGQRLFDLIYRPAETVTMRVARAAGALVANGLDMLLYQGVRSFEIWTGIEPPVDAMRAALRAATEAS